MSIIKLFFTFVLHTHPFCLMKITLAFDSFKGSLSSREVADAFKLGFHKVIPDACFTIVSIADGGEGTTEALITTLQGESVDIAVSNPLGMPVVARYGIIDNGATAVMEMAAASGLTLLCPHERNPRLTSTYGTGEMIAHALDRGCRNFLIGIGGSATNDGGTGMLRALGYRFLDKSGNPLTGGGEILEHIATIDDSNAHRYLNEARFTIACDVTNPLYGAEGAAYVYAPQKGADEAMLLQLDNGLRNYARIIENYTGHDIASMPGAGAAGGMGAGFKAFLNARLERGIEMVLNAMHFDLLIADSNLVVTGEGRIDRQTIMGKAPSGVLQAAQAHNIPTIAVGGSVVWCKELHDSPFSYITAVTPSTQALEVAMQPQVAKENIRHTATLIAGKILVGEIKIKS